MTSVYNYNLLDPVKEFDNRDNEGAGASLGIQFLKYNNQKVTTFMLFLKILSQKS